jgi:hypothetical protein
MDLNKLDYIYEIDQIIAYWRPRLDLVNWDIHVDYDEQQNLASCEARPQYLEMFLRFNKVRMDKEISTWSQLEELVLHELVHARLWMIANFLEPESDDGVKIMEFLEEEAVSQITGALLRTKYVNN